MSYTPHWKDSFWTEKHGSGWVKDIMWDDKRVKVQYSDGYCTKYTFDELDYSKKLFGKGEILTPDR